MLFRSRVGGRIGAPGTRAQALYPAHDAQLAVGGVGEAGGDVEAAADADLVDEAVGGPPQVDGHAAVVDVGGAPGGVAGCQPMSLRRT